jgi:hypothetical protein
MENQAQTEAIADAVVDALAHEFAEKVRDDMRAILDAAETVEQMNDILSRSDGPLSESYRNVAAEVKDRHLEQMEEHAERIASQVLSSLSEIEIERELV